MEHVPANGGRRKISHGRSLDPASAVDRGARFAHDRAAVIATAVLQIICGALLAWLNREPVDMAGARGAVESLLRDEIADIERQAAADRHA